MIAPESSPLPPAAASKSRLRRLLIGCGILVGVTVVYVLSIFGVHVLTRSAPVLPAVDFSKYAADDTIVQVRLDQLKTVANRLAVDVRVYPMDSLYDKNFGVLTTNAAVRLYPDNDLGDLQYPVGKAPGLVATTIEAHGNPANWPFDSYSTDAVAADVFTGSGDNRTKVFARVEVTGSLDGWDATVTRVHDPDQTDPNVLDDVIVTLHRSKGPLIFDLGICLVLISLPTLALVVAIPMALGRRKFLAPFATWYAAMLFAIVPLRNILPGSPPPGSWIDQAVVLWVLIGLVVAMSLFIIAWFRHSE